MNENKNDDKEKNFLQKLKIKNLFESTQYHI